MFRRGGGGEGERGLRGGKLRDDHHEVSIRIRLGGAEGPGRAPWKVSMMTIRPPQHGHRRVGGGVSASRSASAFVLWGETLGAASAWRRRSMLRARDVPAKRAEVRMWGEKA